MAIKNKMIPMNVTTPESKLIYRLRQLKKDDETRIFMVTTTPLSLSVMGKIELLEVPTSGSSIGG